MGADPAALPATVNDPEQPPHQWSKPWQQTFLDNMALLPNASAAARAAGINRNYAYDVRRDDPAFREAWDAAREVGLDLLEQIVHRRATTGEALTTTRTRVKTDAGGNVIERETIETTQNVISNTLLVRLLAAHRPARWGNQVDVYHSGDAPPQAPTGPRKRTRERTAELVEIMRDEGVLDMVIQGGVARIAPPAD